MARSAMKRAHQEAKKVHKKQAKEEEEEEEEVINVLEELEGINTTTYAFIVFDSRSDRDIALEVAEGGIPFEFKGEDGTVYTSTLELSSAPCEPQEVQWSRLYNVSWTWKVCRVFIGIGVVLLALLFWTFGFYYPYARSIMSSDFAHGHNPGVMHQTMFGFVIIGGNVFMYAVCSEVADRLNFKLQGSREMCYMLLYFFACLFNVLCDMVMTYQLAFKQQVGMGVKTHDGIPLHEVPSVQDRFETYAMQKSLGQLLLDYSYPATFLIPFIVEPVATIIAPYYLMSQIVRTHPEIVSHAADAYLAATEFDLSRYADLLVNVMLAAGIFFFPGGYTVYMLGGLAISHIYIYVYDRYRVLYSIPACNINSRSVDICAQWILSVPIGLILACTFFKAHCKDEVEDTFFGACWHDSHLVWHCILLILLHVALHSLVFMVLLRIYPADHKEMRRGTAAHTAEYKKCAVLNPGSWFAVNPIHCLRSKYIYSHDPPCDHWIEGFGHLLRKNPDLHLHFDVPAPRVEHYDPLDQLKDAHKSASRVFKNKVLGQPTTNTNSSATSSATSEAGTEPDP